MKLLIVSATEKEIFPLLTTISIKNYVGDHLRVCKHKNLDIDVLVTGIGMTATAFWLGKILSDKYDWCLNLGLAGSFNKNLEIGNVVNITQDHFAELGAEDGEKNLSLKEIGLEGVIQIVNESKISNKALEGIPIVCGITVNRSEERRVGKECRL